MPRAKPVQTQFNAGELGDEVLGRVDLQRYYQGAAVMLNWRPLVQGGVTRVQGTRYVTDLYGQARVEGFEFAATSGYLLVFVDNGVEIYTAAGALHQSITGAPWAAAEVFEVDFAQNLDSVILTHENWAPHRLFRGAGNVFSLEDLSDPLVASGVYFTWIPKSLAMQRFAGDTYYSLGALVVPTKGNAAEGYYFIVTVPGATGASEPTWDTTVGNSTTSGSVNFECVGPVTDLDAWSDVLGWPRTCLWYEDRLLFGGSPSFPNRLWGSATGEYFNFEAVDSADGDPLDIQLLSDKLNSIRWLAGGRRLAIGTSGSEWASVQDTPLTPTNASFKEQSGIGSSQIKPVSVDGAILHVTRGGDQVRELVYSDLEQAFTTRSLSLLSPLAVDGATQMAADTASSDDDANTVYVVSAGGGHLGVLLTLRDQEVLAWSRRSFKGTVESVAVLNGVVWAVVSNEFGPGVYEDGVFDSGVYEEEGGSSQRFLVYFDMDATMDHSKVVTASPATDTFTGFLHLAGQTVQVLADGFVHPEVEVSATGGITLEYEANTCEAGVPIPEPTLTTMPVVVQAQEGYTVHQVVRIYRALTKVLNSQQLVVNGRTKHFRNVDDDPSQPLEAFTGVIQERFLGRGRAQQVTITAPDPLPVTVQGMTLEVSI